MAHETIQALLHDLAPAARVDEQGQLHIVDEATLRAAMDWLQVDGTFGPAPVKSLARWIVWEAGQALYADDPPAQTVDLRLVVQDEVAVA